MKLIIINIIIVYSSIVSAQPNTHYDYDNKGRMTNVYLDCISVTYAYDNDGNRISQTKKSIEFFSTLQLNTCDAHGASISLESVNAYNYIWSNGQAGSSIVNLVSGIYTVTITDPNSNNFCVKSFEIPQGDSISTSILKNEPTCNSYNNGNASIDTINLPIENYSFIWSNGIHGIRADSLSAGSYSLTVTDNISGCTKTIPFTISEPPSRISSINVNPVSCNGMSDGFASISISGNQAGLLFSWSNGSHSNSISNITAGLYYMTITNVGTGCVEDTMIIVNEPQKIDATATVVMPDCGEAGTGKIQVSATGGTQPYLYSINSGTSYQGSATFQNLASGTYDIIIRDAHYCIDSLPNVEISSANPLNGLQITATSQTLVSPYSEPNNWYVGNNPIPIAQGGSLVCAGNEAYHVTGIDIHGCLAKSADHLCATTDIDDHDNLSSFFVYPSPNHGDFLIDFTCPIGESYSISIADNMGKKVSALTEIATVEHILRPVSLNGFGAGIYYVMLGINEKTWTRVVEVIR